MEGNIVVAIQSLTNPFFDAIFWCFTKLGEETIFLLVLMGIYLLYSKNFALRYVFVYILSVGLNTFVKLVVHRPRPYIYNNLISDRMTASGYSFPSGHTQAYFAQSATAMLEFRRKKLASKFLKVMLYTFLAVGAFVMLSRIYFGQHYLTDVIAGALFGIIIAWLVDYILGKLGKIGKLKETLESVYRYLLPTLLSLTILFLFLEIRLGYVSETVYKFLGVLTAFIVGYFIDKKYIKYQERQGWKQTIFKAIIAYLSVIILFVVINRIAAVQGYICYAVYLFLGLYCTIILPLIFVKIFGKGKV